MGWATVEKPALASKPAMTRDVSPDFMVISFWLLVSDADIAIRLVVNVRAPCIARIASGSGCVQVLK
jgi:hypothetical protein